MGTTSAPVDAPDEEPLVGALTVRVTVRVLRTTTVLAGFLDVPPSSLSLARALRVDSRALSFSARLFGVIPSTVSELRVADTFAAARDRASAAFISAVGADGDR